MKRQINKGTVDLEVFTNFLFVCFKNPFIFQSINKSSIFKILLNFLTQNDIKSLKLSKKVP